MPFRRPPAGGSQLSLHCRDAVVEDRPDDLGQADLLAGAPLEVLECLDLWLPHGHGQALQGVVVLK